MVSKDLLFCIDNYPLKKRKKQHKIQSNILQSGSKEIQNQTCIFSP